MIPKTFIQDTPEDRAYEARVLNLWQLLRIRFWRWRTGRAFDARDKHPIGSWEWSKANERVERRFQ